MGSYSLGVHLTDSFSATSSAQTMLKKCASGGMAGRNGKPTSATFSSESGFKFFAHGLRFAQRIRLGG
jgi:hypothetical protein